MKKTLHANKNSNIVLDSILHPPSMKFQDHSQPQRPPLLIGTRASWKKLFIACVAIALLADHNWIGGDSSTKLWASAFSPSGISSSFPASRGPSKADHFQVPSKTLGFSSNSNRFRPDKSMPSTTALSMFSNPFKAGSIDEMAAKAAAALITLYFVFQCICIVDAGYVGVASTFGNLELYDPGLHFRNPLITNVDFLSTKTQLLEQSNFVPTQEGLTVELDTAVLVRLDSTKAVDLYRSVGPDYIKKLVTPDASSSVRGLTSESDAKALYTSGRSELQNNIRAELTQKLEPKGIMVEDVLLKNVVLPETLSNSIQEKARAEQESQRMEFVLKKETQEAKRKAIEAEGIAEFQRIVAKDISPSLLQWKGIEATEKLAESPNAKVVIVGNNKGSLPVILGNEGSK